MKYFVIFFLFLVLAGVQGQRMQRCRRLRTRCTDSKQCCSTYCRDQRCIRWGTAEDDQGLPHPCSYTTCSVGATCVIDQVQCSRAPCPGVAGCR